MEKYYTWIKWDKNKDVIKQHPKDGVDKECFCDLSQKDKLEQNPKDHKSIVTESYTTRKIKGGT